MKIHNSISKYYIRINENSKKPSSLQLQNMKTVALSTSVSKAKTVYITISRVICSHLQKIKKKKLFQALAIIHTLTSALKCLQETLDVPDDADFVFIRSPQKKATQNNKHDTYERIHSLNDYNAVLCCSPSGVLAYQMCVMHAYFYDDTWNKQLNSILTYYTAYALNPQINTKKKLSLKPEPESPVHYYSFNSFTAKGTAGYLTISSKFKSEAEKAPAFSPVIHTIDPVPPLSPQQKQEIYPVLSHSFDSIELYLSENLEKKEKKLLALRKQKEKKHVWKLLFLYNEGGIFCDSKLFNTDYCFSNLMPFLIEVPTPEMNTVKNNSPMSFLITQRKKETKVILSMEKERLFSPRYLACPPRFSLFSLALEDVFNILSTSVHVDMEALLQSFTHIICSNLFSIDCGTASSVHSELYKEIYTVFLRDKLFSAYSFDY